MQQKSTILMAILLVLVISLTGFISKKEVEKDPQAAKILYEYVEATGGKKAIANIKNLVSKSQLEFMESGFTLERKIVETSSKQYFIKVSSAQTGDIFRIFDGKICRENRQAQIREIVGAEKQSFLNTTAFLRFTDWENTLASYKYEGQKNIAGTEMHRIDITTIYGIKESWYFNKTNHLLVQIEEPIDMPVGPSTAITIFSDYRDVNGVKLSFAQTIEMPGQTRKITFSEIIANQEIDQNLFSFPGEK